MALDPSFDRTKGIGASEASVALGLNPYRRPIDLYLEKVGEVPPFKGNTFTEAGDALEPVTARMYEKRFEVTLAPCATTKHPSLDMLFATPDRRVCLKDQLVELKAAITPASQAMYGDEESGRFPQHHVVQCLVQMSVMNVPETHLAAFVRGELRVYRVERDMEMEKMLLDQLASWWERHVKAGVPPPLEASDTVQTWIATKYPKNDGRILTATPEVAQTMAGYMELRDLLDEQEAQAEALKLELCQLIADSDGIEAPGIGRVTWKLSKDSTGVDWEKLAIDLAKEYAVTPERFAEMQKTYTEVTKKGSRRFLVSREKE